MLRNTISFVNFKGGVGKTSVAVNVAAKLGSPAFNKKVLLVDMDAQANALRSVLMAEQRLTSSSAFDQARICRDLGNRIDRVA